MMPASSRDVGNRTSATGEGDEAFGHGVLAIEKLKDMIVSGRLRPGQRLPREADLAASLGLSRSSLREAVRALSVMRILDVRQGDGTYVSSLAPDSLLEVLSSSWSSTTTRQCWNYSRYGASWNQPQAPAWRSASTTRRSPSSARSSTAPRPNPASITWSAPTSSFTGRSRPRRVTASSPRSSKVSPGRRSVPGYGAASPRRVARTHPGRASRHLRRHPHPRPGAGSHLGDRARGRRRAMAAQHARVGAAPGHDVGESHQSCIEPSRSRVTGK
jgi:DNA-binding transcriptional regulator YhcF (GntR family)